MLLVIGFWLISLANAKQYFNYIEAQDNPDYLTTELRIDNGTEESTITGNITIRRVLNYKITLKLDVTALSRRLIFPIPKVNYCDAVKKLPTTEGVQILIREIENSGLVFARCPLKVGFYQFTHLTLDNQRLPKMSMVKETTSYRFQAVLQDENGKIPVIISKLKGQLTVIR